MTGILFEAEDWQVAKLKSLFDSIPIDDNDAYEGGVVAQISLDDQGGAIVDARVLTKRQAMRFQEIVGTKPGSVVDPGKILLVETNPGDG